MWTTFRIALAYFAAIFIFALIYWVIWHIEKDSFIVHRELNLKPISTLQNLLWKEQPFSAELTEVFTFDEAAKALLPKIEDMKKLKSELVELSESVDSVTIEFDKVIDRLNKNMWQEIDIYKRKSLEEIDSKVKYKESLVEYFSTTRNVESTANAIVLANLNVELATLRLEQAEKRAALSEETLSNLVRFQSPEDIHEVEVLRERREALENQSREIQSVLSEQRALLYEQLEEWITRRNTRLNYLDFVYFSAGISATTTFGDIIPNSRIIRAVVIFQLLLCIFLVGVLISRATIPNKTLNSTPKSGAN